MTCKLVLTELMGEGVVCALILKESVVSEDGMELERLENMLNRMRIKQKLKTLWCSSRVLHKDKKNASSVCLTLHLFTFSIRLGFHCFFSSLPIKKKNHLII